MTIQNRLHSWREEEHTPDSTQRREKLQLAGLHIPHVLINKGVDAETIILLYEEVGYYSYQKSICWLVFHCYGKNTWGSEHMEERFTLLHGVRNLKSYLAVLFQTYEEIEHHHCVCVC